MNRHLTVVTDVCLWLYMLDSYHWCESFGCCRWNNLREMVDQKRDEINVAHGFQNFNIECNETIVSAPLFMLIPCVDIWT